MEKWITVQSASKKFQIPEDEISFLVEKKLITSLKLKDIHVDQDELKQYLDQIKTLSFKKHLEGELYCFFESDLEHPVLLPNIDKNILKAIVGQKSSLYSLIVLEFSKLIEREDMREIFLDKSMGVPNKWLILKYKYNSQQISYLYKRSIDYISKKIGNLSFLEQYIGIITSLKEQMKMNNIYIGNLEEKIKSLENDLVKYRYLQTKKETYAIHANVGIHRIPRYVVNTLTMDICDLGVSNRIISALRTLNIKTVEDLLRHIKSKGLKSLLATRDYGSICHKELKEVLQEKNLLDKSGDSNYFKYL